jgi:dolichol-phosphate mannosyltransferase
MNESVAIVIPTFNEGPGIQMVAQDWIDIAKQVSEHSKVIIIDDGSSDGSGAALQSLAKERPQLLLHRQTNQGHGKAILKGYRMALDTGAEFVFQTDSDKQISEEQFWRFWSHRDKSPVLIGNRSSRQDGFLRVVIAALLRAHVLLLFQKSTPDANCPFRLMSAKALAEALDTISNVSFLTNVALTVRFCQREIAIHWIPVPFGKRQHGQGFVKLSRLIELYRLSVTDLIRLKLCTQSSNIKTREDKQAT